jgi:predicted DNA-binding transcriptional regulator AlpA
MDLYQTPNITTEQLMTADEVAMALRVSKATLFRWMKTTAALPNFFKVGHRWLMRKADFEQLMVYKIQSYKNRY